jgi:hypothetical protein
MAKVAKVYDGSVWQDIATNQPDNSNYPTYTSIQFGFRNELINGDFRINQRAYASGSVLSTSDSATPLGYGYSFDRWKATTSGTFLNFASAPNGQQITISANGSIAQVIERQNITNGTHTLSWIGDAVGRVYNVGATAPAYAASPVTVSLDGTANVIVEYTAVSTPRTLNLVQLEQGGRQTSFEYRPIGTELALCQRYYTRLDTQNPFNSYYTLNAVSASNAEFNIVIPLPVHMRSTPTPSTNISALVSAAPTGTQVSLYKGAYVGGTWTSNVLRASKNHIWIAINGWSGSNAGTSGVLDIGSGVIFEANAEL